MSIVKFLEQAKDSTQFLTPYIIAEAGVNHEGHLDVAFRLIEEAKEGGANAIKFQTYKASTIASKNSPSYWDLTKEPTTSQYDLFLKYDSFGQKEYEILAERCSSLDIEFLSTPFDTSSADFLADLMPAFKISSSDLNNKPFVEYLSKFRKPLIFSTGASYLWEISQTLSWIDPDISIALLHCVLNYPTLDENANLSVISTLKRHFPSAVIGYSDHTLPKNMKTLEVASILGASIIEKHFTHDKSLPGNDHYHSMDKHDLQHFIQRLHSLKGLLGSTARKPLDSEANSRLYARRSLVASNDLFPGDVIQPSNITWKRPGTGIDPRDFSSLVGSRVNPHIKSDDILQWNMFEPNS